SDVTPNDEKRFVGINDGVVLICERTGFFPISAVVVENVPRCAVPNQDVISRIRACASFKRNRGSWEKPPERLSRNRLECVVRTHHGGQIVTVGINCHLSPGAGSDQKMASSVRARPDVNQVRGVY